MITICNPLGLCLKYRGFFDLIHDDAWGQWPHRAFEHVEDVTSLIVDCGGLHYTVKFKGDDTYYTATMTIPPETFAEVPELRPIAVNNATIFNVKDYRNAITQHVTSLLKPGESRDGWTILEVRFTINEVSFLVNHPHHDTIYVLFTGRNNTEKTSS